MWLSLWRLLLALDHAAMPARSFGQQPRTSRSGFGLAIRALSFFNTGGKATTLTRDCPQQILVLDITPLDTAWAHIQEHASPQPLNASNASWACATRGVDVRSGKSRCCTSECHITKVTEHAIRALKGEVRSVFAPQLTVPALLDNQSNAAQHVRIFSRSRHSCGTGSACGAILKSFSPLPSPVHPGTTTAPTTWRRAQRHAHHSEV